MPLARKLLTNFSKGEGSPLLEGRPDLESYFELGSKIENFVVLRQGGLARRIGTRFVASAKFPDLDTVLFSFESSVGDSYIIEVGNFYMRFFKDKARIEIAGVPVEIPTPYDFGQVRFIHYTQSVDVMYLFNPLVPPHRLSRISDTQWSLDQINFDPPPVFENDHYVGEGSTLTPSATSGASILFTASAAVFREADVGRIIIYGASSAMITGFGASAGDTTSPNTKVRADIRTAFPNTSPIPDGSWFLRLSPQTTIDPNIKGPVGATIGFSSAIPAFRASDLHKYIAVYGGLMQILAVTSNILVTGVILQELSASEDADPPATPSWLLMEASWSSVNGYPRTGEFIQGRLGLASTRAEPHVFWLSRSNDFENFATGTLADDALSYAITAKQLNRIEWMIDNKDLFIGTMGSEHRAESGQSDTTFGGDVVPLVRRISNHGSASIQPISVGGRTVFVDHGRRKILAIVFNLEEDSYDPIEITGAAEHITETMVRLGPLAFTKNPDPRLYFIRHDGTLVALTYYYQEKVIGFTRLRTSDAFRAVATRSRLGAPDQVWVVVNRVSFELGQQYIEVFDEDAEEVAGRAWTSLQTDSAKLYNVTAAPTTTELIFVGTDVISFIGTSPITWIGSDAVSQLPTLAGLEHLEGRVVDIVVDGSVRPQQTVMGGQVTLDPPAFQHAEVGLPYVSTVTTMRPTIDGSMLEGVPRNWIQLWARFFETIGGKINNGQLLYPFSPLDEIHLFTGDVQITPEGNYDTDGRVTVIQDQPYPMTLLALFGEIAFGEHT